MKATLIKIFSIHKNVKDTPYEGSCDALPTIGQEFLFDFEVGYFYTTMVSDVKTTLDGAILFTTKNSKYLLCIHRETHV